MARGYVTEYGYRRVRRPGSRRLVMEHVVVWEQYHGPVPPGWEIHHINGDKLDNRIENLKLVTRLEHKRIHSGCFRMNGKWFKQCRRCHWYREVDSEFYVYPGRSGVLGVCKRCQKDLATYYKRRRTRRGMIEQTPAAEATGVAVREVA